MAICKYFYCVVRLITFFVTREIGDVSNNSITEIRDFESKIMSKYLP